MFFAHIPAGYLLTSGMQAAVGVRSRRLMAAGLLASTLPDFDLAWFYLVDGRQTAHHQYFTHTPIFWTAACLGAWVLAKGLRTAGAGLLACVVLANLLLHMFLDSIAAEIRWLWPMSSVELNLVEVPARYGWWVWNFLLHWTMLLEVAVIVAAAFVWWTRRIERAPVPLPLRR